MYAIRYGSRDSEPFHLVESEEFLVVRTRRARPLRPRGAVAGVPLSARSQSALARFDAVAQFADASVELLRAQAGSAPAELRDEARAALKQEREIRFAGRVLVDERSRTPVVYTENLFVKFDGERSEDECRRMLENLGLQIKEMLPYARNAFFAGAPEGSGVRVFELSETLFRDPAVEFCHPELVRRKRERRVFPQQWHLAATEISGEVIEQHASVSSAWSLSRGEGVVIAVIDDGVDIDHEEFSSAGKIVAPLNASASPQSPNRFNPRPGFGANHGTACAGVACAEGRFGASGVAPHARLMPIRLTSGLGSQAEANAIVHAAQRGADIISCSWGPADGDWWDPNDPTHQDVVPLPASTRLAIDWAIQNGRGGRGCVFTWAAGNGNESVDNDGYASFEKVIAVAACNDSGRRSAYSDFGRAVWCCFPSNDGVPSRTPGIWTTDRAGGAGYNSGRPDEGDTVGNYTNSFGGTSSACPGAAGVAALVLARNADLRWDEVRDVLRQSCERIDPEDGRYDPSGHSELYGYGRLNARRAVEVARPSQPGYVSRHTAIQEVEITDFSTSSLSLYVGDPHPVSAVRVAVDLDHTYIGDLIVTIHPPAALAEPIVLHDRQGGPSDNLKRSYDASSVPALGALDGQSMEGQWTLEVRDTQHQDKGALLSFSVELVRS